MFRKFALFCILLCFIVLISGSYTRLSRSGLACPDFPACLGEMIIPDVKELKREDLEKFPKFRFSESRAWNHMVHRYIALGLGVAVLLFPLCAALRKLARGPLLGYSCLALGLLALEAYTGMLSVTRLLSPVFVTLHLLFGMALLGVLQWIFLRANPNISRRTESKGSFLFWLGLLLIFVQIALGGWVSANFAYSACPDFPTCNGRWWPESDFIQGFPLAFQYGLEQINSLSKEARTAILWTHRVSGLFTFICLLFAAMAASKSSNPKRVRVAARLLSLTLFLQIASGVCVSLFRDYMLEIGLVHAVITPLLLMLYVYIRFWSRFQLLDEADIPASSEPETTPASSAVIEPAPYVAPTPENLFERLRSQLGKTRSGMSGVFGQLLGRSIDAQWLDDAETSLIMADVGVEATRDIIDGVKVAAKQAPNEPLALSNALKQTMQHMLAPVSEPLNIVDSPVRPYVILVVGVNGVGKTTTIGKLAKRMQQQGLSVMLAAGDTFRAAAVEQLQEWGTRNDIAVVAQHTGADSASVIYDACESARAKKVDVLIADTAGRLHTKSNLMEELSKIKRILGKLDEHAPHEVLLVLDAGTGQNALEQAKQFNHAVDVTGIVLTKLDGTAKGGMIFSLAKNLGKPIRFIGVGESIDDLQDFDAQRFVDALFAD